MKITIDLRDLYTLKEALDKHSNSSELLVDVLFYFSSFFNNENQDKTLKELTDTHWKVKNV